MQYSYHSMRRKPSWILGLRGFSGTTIYVRYPSDAPVYGTRTSLCAVLTQAHHLHLTETTHAGPTQTALELAWPKVTVG
jgi:hypothetical protein